MYAQASAEWLPAASVSQQPKYAPGQICGAGIAVVATVRIGGVAVEPAAGIERGLASTKELSRTFCEGCHRGFGIPSYAVGKVRRGICWFGAGVSKREDGEGAEDDR